MEKELLCLVGFLRRDALRVNLEEEELGHGQVWRQVGPAKVERQVEARCGGKERGEWARA